MRVFYKVLTMTVVLAAWATPGVVAQTRAAGQGIETLSSTRNSLLINYEEGSTVNVQLEGTSRLPDGEGRAEVRRRLGVTEINVRLDNMKPATLFGGDFATYALWTVSPEGLAINVGEFVLNGDRSELRVTSPLDMFGLFVTAEPHYLVKMPSRFVVLDNTGVGVQRGRTTTRPVEYQGFDGVYEFERESLIRLPAVSGLFRVERQQAAIAIALAERAGASEYATSELQAATATQAKLVASFDGGARQPEQVLLAHETVRLAVAAEQAARLRAQEATLEAEREAARTEIDALTQARTEANRATQQAEEAAARLQTLREQAQQETNEAREEARRFAQLRDEANTQAERDRLAAEEARQAQQAALTAQAAAEAATRQAQLEQETARELAEQSRQEAARLTTLRAEAEAEAAAARASAQEFARLRDEANTQAERDRLAAEEARQAQQAARTAQANAEAAARQAQIEQQTARELAEQSRQEAERLEALRAEAQTEAERAQREADEARNRMENALGLVADTQETARGFIVSLPDILFDTGQATLRPAAREVLSRVAGVLLVAPAYTLSIEGHTDSVGSDEYNQQLSERRAASVRAYLAEAQVRNDLMRTAGFGKTRPVTSNDTQQGRQMNRRVEIVIENGRT